MMSGIVSTVGPVSSRPRPARCRAVDNPDRPAPTTTTWSAFSPTPRIPQCSRSLDHHAARTVQTAAVSARAARTGSSTAMIRVRPQHRSWASDVTIASSVQCHRRERVIAAGAQVSVPSLSPRRPPRWPRSRRCAADAATVLCICADGAVAHQPAGQRRRHGPGHQNGASGDPLPGVGEGADEFVQSCRRCWALTTTRPGSPQRSRRCGGAAACTACALAARTGVRGADPGVLERRWPLRRSGVAATGDRFGSPAPGPAPTPRGVPRRRPSGVRFRRGSFAAPMSIPAGPAPSWAARSGRRRWSG